jgi:dTDP-4-amino-4,6-dideoxygalactose transaminase/nucleoside-diphosphate-sugar epimerase
VIHLACISNDPSFELDPELGRSINYEAFEPLVRLAQDAGVRRFVYASSSSVYGVKAEPEVTEAASLEPLTDYSRYKALCEEILLRYQKPGFTTTIVRPATVCGYSPRQRLDVIVNILTHHAVRTGQIRVFGGEQMRPNIHVRDMAELYALLLELPAEQIAGQVYNAGAENVRVLDIAERVRRAVQRSPIEIVQVETDDPRSYHISSEKLARELGFRARRPLETAVRELEEALLDGRLPDSMDDPRYYNVKTLRAMGSRPTVGAEVGRSRVPYVDLALQHRALGPEIQEAVARVLEHGQFVLGPEVEAFEERFAAYCGSRFAVGVSNGTDALCLALRALGIGPGDEVITAPNSFLASASCIHLVGARPVFVDVREDYNLDPRLLEGAVTSRTRAILPVHLTGRPADMDPVLEVARRHGLAVVEDASQAVGARYRERSVGTFGRLGCFSLHPLKTLGACGDAGVLVTDDEGLRDWLRLARNHGLRDRDEALLFSGNARLDTLQAAILLVKLRYVDGWIAARRRRAAVYREALAKLVEVPGEAEHEFSVYHTFVVEAEERDALRRFLAERGVETRVHYPLPIHRQRAARDLGLEGCFPVAEAQARRILSLPIQPELSDAQIERVIAGVCEFYEAGR